MSGIFCCQAKRFRRKRGGRLQGSASKLIAFSAGCAGSYNFHQKYCSMSGIFFAVKQKRFHRKRGGRLQGSASKLNAFCAGCAGSYNFHQKVTRKRDFFLCCKHCVLE